MSFWNLFLVNLKGIYRNQSGLFWTIIMPVTIYVALSVLPISQFLKNAGPYSHYILPGIIAMQVMQGGIYGLAYWMVDMKSKGVFKRFMVTPISTVELVISLLLARIVVMFIQAIVMTGVGMIFFNAPFYWNVLSIILFVFLGGSIFLLVGLLIATFADTYEAAAPITAGIGLPLTFLGNIFYPVESLPHALQVVANILPITYLADGLRQVYSHPFQFSMVWSDFAVLGAWFVAILLIVLWRFRLEE
jgi:ABC-2 type transport system permease protein